MPMSAFGVKVSSACSHLIASVTIMKIDNFTDVFLKCGSSTVEVLPETTPAQAVWAIDLNVSPQSRVLISKAARVPGGNATTV